MAESSEFRTLVCERDGPVVTITLNRPKALNAINAAMLDDLESAFAALRDDPGVRVVLLTGAGDRAFAAGADIREMVAMDAVSAKAFSFRGQQVFDQIERCGKPVIACVNGVAFGAGCEIALACTLRLGSDKASFALPEAKLGLIPGFGGTQRLTRLIGRGAALQMMLSAQIVNAAEALRLGLIEEIVPLADLMNRARALAETVSSMAPLAVAAILEAVDAGKGEAASEGFQRETEIFGPLFDTADAREGLTAFLERRAPVWQGK